MINAPLRLQETVPHNTDESKVCLFRENNKVITINQPLTLENSTVITKMIGTAIDMLSTGSLTKIKRANYINIEKRFPI
jgi:hypothetical protein